MALSRLLLSRKVFHCGRRGILLSARWCKYSSSENVTQEDKATEDWIASAKSNAKKHPNIWPKATEAENNLGGSWCSLKDIYINFKEKILGNRQGQKQISNEISRPPIKAPSSKAIMTQISADGAKSRVSESLHLLSEVATDSLHSEQMISTSVTSKLLGEKSSETADNTTAYEVTKLHSPDKFKPSEPDVQVVEAPKNISCTETENLVQYLASMTISPCNERNTSNSVGYPVTEENLCKEIVGLEEEMARSKGTLNNFPTISPENEQWPEKKKGGCPPYSDIGQKNEQLIGFTSYLLDDAFAKIPNEDADEFSTLETEACQHEKKSTSSVVRLNDGHTRDEKVTVSNIHMLQDGCKMEQMPPAPVGNQNDDGLLDFNPSETNQTEGQSAGVYGNLLRNIAFSNISDETSQENVSKTFDLQSKIRITAEHSGVQSTTDSQDIAMSNVTDHISNEQSNGEAQLLDKVLNACVKRKKTLVEDRDMSKDDNRTYAITEEKNSGIASIMHNEIMTRNDRAGNLDTAGNGHLELETTPKVPPPMQGKSANFTGSATAHKLLLRFLTKNIQEKDIEACLQDCGPILKIQKLFSPEESLFYDAIIHFDKKKTLQKALKKTGLLIKGATPFFQSFSAEDLAHKKICIPDLLGDPEAPVALLKHPTRTVKIEHLNGGISLNQLEGALSFCGSGITGFFTSGSAAYVEFKEDDAKERALEKHSIYVSGEQLLMFRVDAPRTTVVRINNIDTFSSKRVMSVCRTHGISTGEVHRVRGMHTMDVHYSVDDWPNMLNILNSLNGLEVDGSRWVAKPAPIFPPQILQVLWSHPEGRQHVKEVIRRLLKETCCLGPELVDGVAKHYAVDI